MEAKLRELAELARRIHRARKAEVVFFGAESATVTLEYRNGQRDAYEYVFVGGFWRLAV